MDASKFFTRVAMLLPGNPPAKDDAPMLAKLKQLGIEPGKPFAVSDPAVEKQLQEGAKQAIDAVTTASKGLSGADIRNGGASIARSAAGATITAGAPWRVERNRPQRARGRDLHEHVSRRRRQEARRRQSLRSALRRSARAARRRLLVGQHVRRQAALRSQPRSTVTTSASTDRIKTNADGSIDIYISNDKPPADKEANWLPAPKGPFSLILRVYWPKDDVINGRWNPPGVRPAS
jgi:hypothetical protein